MKKIFVLFYLLFLNSQLYSQAVKPTLMILPDKLWMSENNFVKSIDNEGETNLIYDYELAMIKNPDLSAALDKITGEFLKAGFKSENLLQTLDEIKTNAAEDALRRTSKGADGGIRINNIDEIRRKAKTDIEIYIYWKIDILGPRKRITDIRMKAIDTYTNQVIATSPGKGGDWVSISEVSNAELIRESIVSEMDAFKSSLQLHFDDLFANGRELKLRILTWETAPFDLETDSFGDDELNVLIKNWVRKNAYLGRFSPPTYTETRMEFKSIRIPLSDENGRLDGEDWAKGLVKYLKSIKVTPIKTDPKGLGSVDLILGGK
jgi:hypothetical protein